LGIFYDVNVSVTKSGSGTGLVTSSVGGINCGTACNSVAAISINVNTSITLSALADAGFIFTGWSGVTCNEGQASASCTFTTTGNPGDTNAAVATFATSAPILNIDNSDAATTYDPATDGVLLMRYLLGYRGAALVANAQGIGASLRDSMQIENHVSTSLAPLDVDGDGETLALTDGVMILRRLLNPGAAITNAAAMSAITAGAKRGSRSDADVVNAIDALKPN
jgi:hypothetical protein